MTKNKTRYCIQATKPIWTPRLSEFTQVYQLESLDSKCLFTISITEPRGNMKNLSLYKKYTAAELGKELNFPKRLTNGIRKNFGDLISLYELKQINWGEFRACKGFGLKSWYKFREAMSQIEDTDKAVKVIDRQHHPKKIIVEIDISEPFDKVIQDLSHIIPERK